MLLFGLVLIALGAAAIVAAHRRRDLRFAMIGASTSEVRDIEIEREALVELGSPGGFRRISAVVGHAHPDDDGPLRSPQTGTECVWWRRTVRRQTGQDGAWEMLEEDDLGPAVRAGGGDREHRRRPPRRGGHGAGAGGRPGRLDGRRRGPARGVGGAARAPSSTSTARRTTATGRSSSPARSRRPTRSSSPPGPRAPCATTRCCSSAAGPGAAGPPGSPASRWSWPPCWADARVRHGGDRSPWGRAALRRRRLHVRALHRQPGRGVPGGAGGRPGLDAGRRGGDEPSQTAFVDLSTLDSTGEIGLRWFTPPSRSLRARRSPWCTCCSTGPRPTPVALATPGCCEPSAASAAAARRGVWMPTYSPTSSPTPRGQGWLWGAAATCSFERECATSSQTSGAAHLGPDTVVARPLLWRDLRPRGGGPEDPSVGAAASYELPWPLAGRPAQSPVLDRWTPRSPPGTRGCCSLPGCGTS